MNKYQTTISVKGMTPPIQQIQFVAKDQKEADAKGTELAKNFKTTDQLLKETIQKAGGLEAETVFLSDK